MAGNTIDFFAKIEEKTFQQAMEIITASNHYAPPEQDLRKERGSVAKSLR